MSFFDFLSIAAAFAVIAWFVKVLAAKDRDAERYEEDDARKFFDEHGHWPDETQSDADARRAQGDAAERVARTYQD
jgi:hypothetical protein